MYGMSRPYRKLMQFCASVLCTGLSDRLQSGVARHPTFRHCSECDESARWPEPPPPGGSGHAAMRHQDVQDARIFTAVLGAGRFGWAKLTGYAAVLAG